MAIINQAMNVSIAEARNRFARLIRVVEKGEPVLITRRGKPVAQLIVPTQQRRKVVFGGMKDQVKLRSGWDDPIDLDPARA
jgi:prevent-host-death family protein